jgi:thymidylate synthase ThyX
MTGHPRRVYLLDPRDLPPETIAVAFAKTSRSPEPFDRIAAELSEERSADFHEKWVVGYGHSSVAEHAVLHIAMENVSRLAIESVESNRLASFTEKSTRYQKWSADAYVLPVEFQGSPAEALFTGTCRTLLKTYRDSLEQVGRFAREKLPRQDGESETRWDARIRVWYVDVCRYLLPAAVLANVGVTINARALEHAIRKMLSHPLAEVRALGAEVKRVAIAEVPTLVKYAEPNAYLQSLPQAVAAVLPSAPSPAAEYPRVKLLSADPDGELRAFAAAAVRYTGAGYEDTLAALRSASEEDRRRMSAALLGGMDRHDAPLRELEHMTYTAEAVLDQGAYFEVKRHRMMSQTPAPLTCDLGYVTPRWMEAAGFRARYDSAMQHAGETYCSLRKSHGADAAAYPVPNGYLRRLVFTFNLREAYQFCELRSSPNAHPAVRVIARSLASQIRAIHPNLAGFLRLGEEPADPAGGTGFLTD